MEATRVDLFFVWLISLLLGALVTSIFVIILVNLKARLKTTEKKLNTLTMAVTSQMNVIGDTLKSIAGDIAGDSISTSNSTTTRSSAEDTCTIQLVQDWLELEVLDEPVKQKTEEPTKLGGLVKPDEPVLDQVDGWGVPLAAYDQQYDKYSFEEYEFKCLKDEDADEKAWPLLDLDEGSIISTDTEADQDDICNI